MDDLKIHILELHLHYLEDYMKILDELKKRSQTPLEYCHINFE